MRGAEREDEYEYVKGDWIDVLRKHILETVAANDALAFYGVILLKGGKVESIWSPYSMWPYGPKEARKAIPSHAYLCVGRKTLRQGVKEMFSL